MNTKLTLTIEQEIIKKAKKYASTNGRSLSEMVENYFKLLTEPDSVDRKDRPSSKIQKLQGSVKVSDDFDYEKILEEERLKKHGL
ncbi:MAG: DUF6364 family protein [Bacteroidota bacterium]